MCTLAKKSGSISKLLLFPIKLLVGSGLYQSVCHKLVGSGLLHIETSKSAIFGQRVDIYCQAAVKMVVNP